MRVNFVTANLAPKSIKSANKTIAETKPQTITSSASNCMASFGRASVSLGENFPKRLQPGSKINGKVTENGFTGFISTPKGQFITFEDGVLTAAGAKRYIRRGDSTVIETRNAFNNKLGHSCEINHSTGSVERKDYDIMGTPKNGSIVDRNGERQGLEYDSYGRIASSNPMEPIAAN